MQHVRGAFFEKSYGNKKSENCNAVSLPNYFRYMDY